jgi:mono/diheme cytochrome c family protein
MRKWLGLLVIAGFAGLGIFWVLSAPRPAIATPNPALEQGGDAERGRIVFLAGGCASCHMTPGQENQLKLGGGYEMPSPFGTFYAPNISPHPTDGIGKWTTADMANALISGVSPQGSHYFPAFPYTSYTKMKLDDVKDLMAYMRTLEPVAGKAKAHDVPFPFNIRRSLGMWKLLFFDTRPLIAPPGASPQVQRGQYLVEALSHCAECHSPRNMLGGIESGRRFAGGPDPAGKAWNPNISQHPRALGEWTAKDIAGFLKTGFNMEGDVVGGSMGSVIKNMAQMPEADLLAMGEYMKTLPALVSTPAPAKK